MWLCFPSKNFRDILLSRIDKKLEDKQSGALLTPDTLKLIVLFLTKDLLGVQLIDVYILTAMSMAIINFVKSIPACISPGSGKNGSTVAVSDHNVS